MAELTTVGNRYVNVGIITTESEGYHQYLCAEIAKHHNLVAVFHPQRRTYSRVESRKLRKKNIKNNGWVFHCLKKMASIKKLQGWDEKKDVAQAEHDLMPQAREDYQKLVAPIAVPIADVNSPSGIAEISKFRPDVLLCSGGPIYRRKLIESCPLMLNFHTGISPIYNGSRTIYWTFANRQPYMTGGTLMQMSPIVDGGDILGHFLPDIEPNDTPGRQFIKTIRGAVEMYSRFLQDLERGASFVSVPQGRPFHLQFEYEWTVYQTLAINRAIKQNICEKHVRDAIAKDYWKFDTRETAVMELKNTILELVYHVNSAQ